MSDTKKVDKIAKGDELQGRGAPKDAKQTKATKKDRERISALEEKLDVAQKEAQENYDRFLRVSAEFENYQKRTVREMADFRKFANEALIKDLLQVVDNIERAIASVAPDPDKNGSVVEGIQLTLKDILKILDKFNVKPIVSMGETFDPVFHQAMLQEESAEYPANTVIRELQKGYVLHDRLLRPAMVVVAKAAAKEKKRKEN